MICYSYKRKLIPSKHVRHPRHEMVVSAVGKNKARWRTGDVGVVCSFKQREQAGKASLERSHFAEA